LAATASMLLTAPGATQGNPVVEAVRPRFWFYTMAAPNCSTGINMPSYTLTLTQADGNQLSYEMIGLPAVYGCFWAIYVVGFLVHTWFTYVRPAGVPQGTKFRPVLVIFFTASIGLETLSLFCHMISWATLQTNGVGVPFFDVVGAGLRIVSWMALWMTAGLLASGYGVSTYNLAQKANWRPVLLLTALFSCYIGMSVWLALDQDPRSTASFAGTTPAILLLVFTLLYAVWFYWALRATYRAEITPAKKAFLRRAGFALGANFFVLPLAGFIGAVTPPYEALRVQVGIDTFLITVINAATAWAVWPSKAAEAFRVFDGSQAAAMLGGDGMDQAHLDAGLDQAYAYASMGEAGNAAGSGSGGGAPLLERAEDHGREYTGAF
jgi:hypothetical protein